MKKKLQRSTIALIVGILLFLVGCIPPFIYENAKESGYEVDAVIVEVVEKDDIDSESGYVSTAYGIYADYEVDGKEYKHVKVATYYDTCKYGVGDTIQVVVNPNRPGRPLYEGGVLCVIGFLVTGGAIISKIRKKVKEK